MVGGKVFHIYHYSSGDFSWGEIFFPWNHPGRVFYGALIGGFLGLLVVALRYPEKVCKELFDEGFTITALGYGILRLGCFSSGCCWGKMSGQPWAVTFTNSHSVMPYLGVPVHPVQLYDSFLGFFLFFLLLFLRKKGVSQSWAFLFLFPVGRFITEFFRGDPANKLSFTDVVSFSQLISIGLFMLALLAFVLSRSKWWRKQSAQTT